MVTYTATSLEDIAQMFDKKATENRTTAALPGKTKKATEILKNVAFAYEQSAWILRHTVLVPPEPPA
jgi:hypothetical protein